MKASLFYRAAAILLVLFAAGHLFGFSQVDPQWHVDELVRSLRTIHFDAIGSSRSYWDFYLAAGICVGLFDLLSAVLAWQLAALSGSSGEYADRRLGIRHVLRRDHRGELALFVRYPDHLLGAHFALSGSGSLAIAQASRNLAEQSR